MEEKVKKNITDEEICKLTLDKIGSDSFACVGGKAVVNKNRYQMNIYSKMTNEKDIQKLYKDLCKFTDEVTIDMDAWFLLEHRRRDPSALLCATKLLHHMSNIFWDTLSPPNPAGGHVESKLRQRIREKKIAMGHKPDDHEEYQGPSMSM